jgi:hypothetical protein
LDIYWNILKMHGPINIKSPNNTSKWQMGFNSEFKGLTDYTSFYKNELCIKFRKMINPVLVSLKCSTWSYWVLSTRMSTQEYHPKGRRQGFKRISFGMHVV